MPFLPDELRQWLPAVVVVAAVCVVLVFIVLWRLLRRQKRPVPRVAPVLTIAVQSLGDHGPPAGPPTLELYNIPVRLAALIMAPVGRVRRLPPPDELSSLLEALLPGLGQIERLHRPLLRDWPAQVSTRGFAHVFFSNARLPGDGGKGTPWSSAAGTFKYEGQPFMAALILRAAAPNSLGQIAIYADHQWLDCLRVKWD
jgi:hypothetical protein